MGEHSSIYTASNRSGSRGDPESPDRKMRHARPQANLTDEVLRTLLHELRTPLAVVTGWSRMLEQQYAEHADEFLRRGLSQVTKYTSVQSALLARAGDFCDLWAGHTTLNRERVDLFDLARVALRAQQATAAQRGVQQAATSRPPRARCSGDYVRLRQMIADLLGTALEATPLGRRLQVHGTVTEHLVVLSLHDVGETPRRGQPRPDTAAHATSDERSDRRQLALAIASGLLALHGGALITSGHEAGALTTLRLPRCGTGSVRDPQEPIPAAVDAEQ